MNGRVAGSLLRQNFTNVRSSSGYESCGGHDIALLMTASMRLPPASLSTRSKGETPYIIKYLHVVIRQ